LREEGDAALPIEVFIAVESLSACGVLKVAPAVLPDNIDEDERAGWLVESRNKFGRGNKHPST